MPTNDLPLSTPGLLVLPVFLAGPFDASVEGVIQFRLPTRARIASFQAFCRTSEDTEEEALTIDLLADGESVLDEPVAVAAGAAPVFAVVATEQLADEAVVSVNIGVDGEDAEFSDITLVLTLARN